MSTPTRSTPGWALVLGPGLGTAVVVGAVGSGELSEPSATLLLLGMGAVWLGLGLACFLRRRSERSSGASAPDAPRRSDCDSDR